MRQESDGVFLAAGGNTHREFPSTADTYHYNVVWKLKRNYSQVFIVSSSALTKYQKKPSDLKIHLFKNPIHKKP